MHFDDDGDRASLTQLFGLDGERQDPRTGLVQLRARWYQPSTGRMLGRDPFAGYATQPLRQHPYLFALNNPLRYADPTGRSAAMLNAPTGPYAIKGTSLYRDPSALQASGPDLLKRSNSRSLANRPIFAQNMPAGRGDRTEPFYIFIGGRGEVETDVASHWGQYIRSIDPNGDNADLTQLSGSNWQVYTWDNGGTPGGANNTGTPTEQEAQHLRADIDSIKDSSGTSRPVILIGDSKGGALAMEYLAEIAEDPTNHAPQQVIGAAAIGSPLGGDELTLGAGFSRYRDEIVQDPHDIGPVQFSSPRYVRRDRLENLQSRLAAAGMSGVHLATVDQTSDPFSTSLLPKVHHYVFTPANGLPGHGEAREDPTVMKWVLSEVQTGDAP